MNDELLGNLTSTVKTILLLFAGWCIGYFISIGLDLPIDAEQLSEILFMLLCLGWSYLDMKYPNAFKWLKKAPDKAQEPIMEQILNDEYV